MTQLPAPFVFRPAPVAPRLEAGAVHLWRVPLSVPSPSLRALLSPDEWIRAEQFHFPCDTDRFVASRGMLRRILGAYMEADPAALNFRTMAHGKPELEQPGSTLRFNLSHSGELMLLAVTHAREVGVDLEAMRDGVPFDTLSEHYFEPEDAWAIRILPQPEKAIRFYELWTRTEARLKASGAGLGDGLKIVEPDRWSLLSLTPAEGYAAALAVEGGKFQLACWSCPQ